MKTKLTIIAALTALTITAAQAERQFVIGKPFASNATVAVPSSTPKAEMTEKQATVAVGGFFIVFLIAYFFPAIVAGVRRHHNEGAILVINFFLGWTLVGWFAALAWAATNPSKQS